jgi:purine-binding chemotaxis protein CheW
MSGCTDSAAVIELRLEACRLAVPVGLVRDVVARPALTPVPGAPAAVAGLWSLRGRIVTALDLRRRLELAPAPRDGGFAVVVELDGQLYGLLVDAVGGVAEPPAERLPPAALPLPPAWHGLVAAGWLADGALVLSLEPRALLAPVAAA